MEARVSWQKRLTRKRQHSVTTVTDVWIRGPAETRRRGHRNLSGSRAVMG